MPEGYVFNTWEVIIEEDKKKRLNLTSHNMKTKFLLMGLPGTGKTTTFTACADLLRKNGIDCNVISTDSFINTRFKPDDPVIKAYEKRHNIKIASEIFSAPNPSGAFIKVYGEEPAFRDLEENFLIDILTSYKQKDWYDFGGKALMRSGTMDACEKKRIIPIFLYAEHNAIIERLGNNDAWRNRPLYVTAAENSADGKGWQALAHTQREARLAKYMESAVIMVAVERNSAEVLNFNEQKSDSSSYKSADVLAKEIFFRVCELQKAVDENNNNFTNSISKFFKKHTLVNTIDKKTFADTQKWLETELTRCKAKKMG